MKLSDSFSHVDYSLNSILYQRGVYPEETFKAVQHYGITMFMSKDPKIESYIKDILPKLQGNYLSL